MSDQHSPYIISQDMDIVKPQKASAIPVTTFEWCMIKESIEGIEDSNSFFHTIGSALIGAALSTGIAALILPLDQAQDNQLIIMWAATAVFGISGGLSLYFAHKQKDIIANSAKQVVSKMEAIEERFPVEGLTKRSSGRTFT